MIYDNINVTNNKYTMKNQIKSIEDLKTFVQYLNDNDKLFHFEDDPADIINFNTDKATFTDEECKILNKRIDEICELNLLEEAFELALACYEEAEEDYIQAWRASLTDEQLKQI
jgi:hypothetical protein